MILVVAATEMEMQPLFAALGPMKEKVAVLLSGVGPMETAVRLTRVLCTSPVAIEKVINFGIAGCYLQKENGLQPQLLDICLAEQEIIGDLGICVAGGMDYLDPALTGNLTFPLDQGLLREAREILARHGEKSFAGTFITVNAASASSQRGNMLCNRWHGLCENMEGAAVARACREFAIPCLEMRAISNFVEDRDYKNWKLQEACLRAAECAALVIKGLCQ